MRDIVETEKISDEQLDGVHARLEQNSEDRTVIEETGTEAERIFRYKFEEEDLGEIWYGQIDIEIYDKTFQARGDEALLNRYFAENRIQEIEY
ncbi:hypothetical protein ACK3SF_03710 [Candidatus Nanosalina sp. VS9-1]|uniref:hypothetical protein n=1 Tax=Candidatus Nanosalina sp. VS9-1 TaxID=3388566 RepID=UPI0039E08307